MTARTTDELAALLGTDAGLASVRALQGLGVLGRAPPPEAPGAGPQPILAWKPLLRDGTLTFERGDLFRCKPRVIGPRAAGALRVCLFGESMAAGFPLAPGFSPAIALEEMLRTAAEGGREVEVLDLAMPNLGPSEQLRVCEAARQLTPDVCVLMAGNNWYYGLSVEPTAPVEARVHYAEHLAEGGPARLAEVFRRQLADRARVMVKAMVEAARSAGALAIVVVPAANHAWERRATPPWLGDGRTAAWFEALGRARRARAEGDVGAEMACAGEMEALEGALTGTPQRLLARALLDLGRPAEARDAATRAIDASNWHNSSWALPQVPSMAAAAMRETAASLGCPCVDLEALFAEHTGSPFLDFRLFYDHCHLTVEGTQVAMAEVGARVASGALARPTTREALLAGAPRPTALVAASAALQAAHWASQFFPGADAAEGALNDRLAAGLRDAVALEPGCVPVLRDLVRLKTPACPPDLHAAMPRAAQMPGIAALLLSRRLEAPLLAALLEVLNGDEGTRAALARLLADWDAALRCGLDLTGAPFRAWFWERTPLAWDDPHERQGSPFYRAAWPASHFDFLTGGDHDLALGLVWRSPFAAAGATATVLLDGRLVAEGPVTPRWGRHTLVLERAALPPGAHRISLGWPSLQADEAQAIEVARGRLALGAPADLFPVFGEVYSLTLRRCTR